VTVGTRADDRRDGGLPEATDVTTAATDVTTAEMGGRRRWQADGGGGRWTAGVTGDRAVPLWTAAGDAVGSWDGG
jgi:hypothetical protein